MFLVHLVIEVKLFCDAVERQCVRSVQHRVPFFLIAVVGNQEGNLTLERMPVNTHVCRDCP